MPRTKSTCNIEGCDSPCVGHGYCRKHYNRWYKFGDPLKTLKVYRNENPICSVENCDNPTLAKGFCEKHYALFRKYGDPERRKVFKFEYIKDGYRYVYVSYRHYEPEHRVVMEKFLGRKLKSSEDIHHIDGNTLNNSPSNLQVLSRAEHARIHRNEERENGIDRLNEKRVKC